MLSTGQMFMLHMVMEMMIMTEISSADFMKLSINDVSDLLLEQITDEKSTSYALLKGTDGSGRMFNLCVKLELVE